MRERERMKETLGGERRKEETQGETERAKNKTVERV